MPMDSFLKSIGILHKITDKKFTSETMFHRKIEFQMKFCKAPSANGKSIVGKNKCVILNASRK